MTGRHLLDLLLSRPAVIGLAIAGAAASTLASFAQVRGIISQKQARFLNALGYTFMGISIVLFIVIGYRGPA